MLAERKNEMSREWRRGEYVISTERGRLDVGLIHKFLSETSYWATGRPREVVERSIEHSLAFGIYQGERQVGFARVTTRRSRGSRTCSCWMSFAGRVSASGSAK